MDYIRLQWFERVWPETREQLKSCANVIVVAVWRSEKALEDGS